MFPLFLLMLIVGISMFTARGKFPDYLVRLAEICFVFNIHVLILGIFLVTIGFGFKKIKLLILFDYRHLPQYENRTNC